MPKLSKVDEIADHFGEVEAEIRAEVRRTIHRIDDLEKGIGAKFSGVEEELGFIGTMVQQLAQFEMEHEKREFAGIMLDAIWPCAQCRVKLAIYDKEKDELRIRHRGTVTYVHPGVDGYVKLICWKCGAMNEIRDTRAGGEENEGEE